MHRDVRALADEYISGQPGGRACYRYRMTRLGGILLAASLLFSANTAFAACDPSCFTCSGTTAADCTSCFSGSYLGSNPGPCTSCTPISQCVSPLTCTSATTSQCTSCNSGFYVANGTADSCPPCT